MVISEILKESYVYRNSVINKGDNRQESEVEQTVAHDRDVERGLVKAHFKPAADIGSARAQERERYEKWQQEIRSGWGIARGKRKHNRRLMP